MSKRPIKTDRRPSDTESDDAPFLSRWARRKRLARTGGDPEAREPGNPADDETLAGAAPDAGGVSLENRDQPPVELTDEDMPPVDSIDEDTDMSGFFSPKVSHAVKKAALRKFFHSPAFNIVDGLDDYDDDFTTFAALGDIVTSDMRGVAEREAARAKEALAENDASIEPAAGPEETAAHTGEADASQDEPAHGDSGADAPQRAGDHRPGITRDPARHAGAGPGKLRPRRDADGET